MTEKLPKLSGVAILKALRAAGYGHKSTRGDHVKVEHPDTGRTVIVPLYDTIADGLFASILRQAGMSRDEFAKYL